MRSNVVTSAQCGWKESHAQKKRAADLRWEFWNTLQSATPATPERSYEIAAAAWCKVSNAKWSWLWLADRLPGTTELQLVAGHDCKSPLLLPKELAVTNVNSVAAFCLANQRPQFVDDLKHWQGGEAGSFRVGLADFLIEHGCSSFLCVPIKSRGSATTPKDLADSNVHGALCLHFTKNHQPVLHNYRDIMMMAWMTAKFIESSHYAHQRRIFIGLSEIANRHVSVPGRSAFTRRTQYVQEVIGLLRSEFSVNGISVFFLDPLRQCLECIATTGLTNSRGDKISDPAMATYELNAGLTGRCVASGSPFFSTSHTLANAGEPRFLEVVDDQQPRLPAAAIYPIPRPSAANQPIVGPMAAGAIRLVQHSNPKFDNRRVKFDSLYISTLELIAREMGIVLSGMTSSIQKERMLESVKHDNGRALNILNNLMHRLRKGSSRATGRREIDKLLVQRNVDAIEYALLLATNINSDIGTVYIGEEQYEPELTDLTKLVKGVASLVILQPREDQEENIHPVKVEGAVLPRLYLDRSMIDRAMLNLLDNAIKYSSGRAPVRVILGLSPSVVFVEILNDGPGIEPSEVDRVFLPGERGMRAVAHAGTGMGLALARQVIVRHGGQLVLHKPSNPTIFRITLPLALSASPKA